jgi:hypothetical protein
MVSFGSEQKRCFLPGKKDMYILFGLLEPLHCILMRALCLPERTFTRGGRQLLRSSSKDAVPHFSHCNRWPTTEILTKKDAYLQGIDGKSQM